MYLGILSGIFWALDTVILGLALGIEPLASAVQGSLIGACLHDIAAAVFLFVVMGLQGRLKDTWAALKTKGGRVIMAGALLGGPLGMSGYLWALNTLGPGLTAAISAFYPAVGTVLAVLVLKEKMSIKQVFALLCAIAGIVLMSWTATSVASVQDFIAGLVGAIICVVGWGSEAVLLAWGMKDEGVDNEVALQIRETTSALVYTFVVIPLFGAGAEFVATAPQLSTLLVCIAAALGTVSYLFYYKAIEILGAARAMAINISYCAWAVVFTGLFSRTMPSALSLVCCVVIMVGTVLCATANWQELLPTYKKR